MYNAPEHSWPVCRKHCSILIRFLLFWYASTALSEYYIVGRNKVFESNVLRCVCMCMFVVLFVCVCGCVYVRERDVF